MLDPPLDTMERPNTLTKSARYESCEVARRGPMRFTLSVRRSALAKLELTLPADIAARVNDWVD